MEKIDVYEPNVIPDEVEVTYKNITELFGKKTVYVFGYGSLLYSRGWRRRGMRRPPEAGDLIECVLKDYERGPFATHGAGCRLLNFYGIIKTPGNVTNGVLVKIQSFSDWKALMETEMVAGIVNNATYRVADVTKLITRAESELPKNRAIHAVANRPVDRTECVHSAPYGRYYENVWDGVLLERSKGFQEMFLKTGGLKGRGFYHFESEKKTR